MRGFSLWCFRISIHTFIGVFLLPLPLPVSTRAPSLFRWSPLKKLWFSSFMLLKRERKRWRATAMGLKRNLTLNYPLETSFIRREGTENVETLTSL